MSRETPLAIFLNLLGYKSLHTISLDTINKSEQMTRKPCNKGFDYYSVVVSKRNKGLLFIVLL